MTGATIVQLFTERARTDGDAIALQDSRDGRALEDERSLTWREWYERSRGLAASLASYGLKRGDRVAILAGNSNVWPIADLAVLMAGAASVGIYPTSSREQVAQLLRDSGAVMAIAEGPERCATLADAAASAPAVRELVGTHRPNAVRLIDWHECVNLGRFMKTRWNSPVDARAAAVAPDDLALLIYTSGSTGEPKGARILHRTVLASAESVRDTLGFTSADSTLSFLPYSHAGERIFGLYTRILCGMCVRHVGDGEDLWAAARETRPSVFGGLPRWFEKIHEALRLTEREASDNERARWQRAIELGMMRASVRRRGGRVPPDLERDWRAASAPCRSVIERFLGDRVRLATSGGARLDPDIADYLDAAGLTVLGAYGQTEHLCAAFHRPDRYDTETVGPPMPGTVVRLDDDGELLIRRSDLTFDGYDERPAETRAAFTEDGEWLHTGDLAELRPDGRIRITGRKKELIALSNGKKVAPLAIEAALVAEPWIANAMLYGEGERFISALLVPSRATVDSWLTERGLDETFEQAVGRDEIHAEIAKAVERVNARFSRPEQVRRWVILDHELSAERGELTPTMKIRRGVVTERYRDRLQPLYHS